MQENNNIGWSIFYQIESHILQVLDVKTLTSAEIRNNRKPILYKSRMELVIHTRIKLVIHTYTLHLKKDRKKQNIENVESNEV